MSTFFLYLKSNKPYIKMLGLSTIKNPLIVHIITEIIVLVGVVFWFSSKQKRLQLQIEKLLLRIEDQEDKIFKLENALEHLYKTLASVPVSTPVQMASAPVSAPVQMASAPVSAPVQMASVPVSTPVQMASVPVSTPVQMASVPVSTPVQMASVPVSAPVQMASVPVSTPVQMASALVSTPVQMASNPPVELDLDQELQEELADLRMEEITPLQPEQTQNIEELDTAQSLVDMNNTKGNLGRLKNSVKDLLSADLKKENIQ
jgi:hypothetical protein